MPIPIACGTCGAEFKAPDEAAGRRSKCPKCKASFSIPGERRRDTTPAVAQAADPAPPVPPAAPALPPPRPPVLARPSTHRPEPIEADSADEYKECPFCGEDIKARAKKCKHCGETIDVTLRKAEEAERSSRRRERPLSVRQETYVDAGYRKAPFNHSVHIILDVLTCGSWLPIHLICWACH